MKQSRISMTDVAENAGVSCATVSRALRNDRRISAATRKKVEDAAAELGYRPDPLVSAFVRRRVAGMTTEVTTIAWLVSHPSSNQFAKRLFAGAERRAEERGYRLDRIVIGERRFSPARITQILVARGIRGVCIAPLNVGRGHLAMGWEHFASVAVGFSMVRPAVHRAVPDQFRGMLLALRKLRTLGYRRMALVITPSMNVRTDYQWQAAHLLFGKRHRMKLPFYSPLPFNPERFIEWYRETNPEVIVTHSPFVLGWLRDAGVSVPQDVALADLNWNPEQPEVSGIDQQPHLVGEAAIDLCIGRIESNDRGIPENPAILMVEGRWHQGASAPGRD